MNEETKPEGLPPEPATPASEAKAGRKRPAWLPAALLLGAFLVGLVPMWLRSHIVSGELDHVRQQQRLDLLQIKFADAALSARRGEYEPARRGMAEFFSLATAEMARGKDSVLAPETRDNLQTLLEQRDDLITLLARGDPASAEKLGAAYAAFKKTLGG